MTCMQLIVELIGLEFKLSIVQNLVQQQLKVLMIPTVSFYFSPHACRVLYMVSTVSAVCPSQSRPVVLVL